MHKRQFIGIGIGLAAFGLIWTILTPILFPIPRADAESAPFNGFSAPDFNLETPDGENHTLSDHQGSPTLVFFWASWCAICKRAMPDLEEVFQTYRDQGFNILAVNVRYQDDYNAALAYFETSGYSYTMLVDEDGSVADAYRLHALPTSILINSDGVITSVTIGAGMTQATLSAELEQLLQKEQ